MGNFKIKKSAILFFLLVVLIASFPIMPPVRSEAGDSGSESGGDGVNCCDPTGPSPAPDQPSSPAPACSDGTIYGACSGTRPLFCDNGNLVNRASACNCPPGLIIQGNDCMIPPTNCSDGTPINQCSSTRPLLCTNGNLVSRAGTCGCPSGQAANGDICIAQPRCSDGTLYSQCSTIRPLFCNNGSLVNLASVCGCPVGTNRSGEICTFMQACSDGTLFGQCSSNPPLFCDNGNLVNRASSCGCPANQVPNGNNCVPSGGGDIIPSAASGKLVISDADASIGNKHASVRDNRKISRKAMPGQTVEFEITVENTYNKSANIGINDIVVRATIGEIDEDDDLEEESNEFDLEAQGDKKSKLRFKIPENAEEGEYNVEIEAEGEDENGIEHMDSLSSELEVTREKNLLKISLFEIKPEKFNCSDNLEIKAQVDNLGSEDQANAMLEISSSAGINYKEQGLQINADENSRLLKALKITALGAEKGVYPVTLNVYSDDGKLQDTSVANAEVKNCDSVLTGKESVMVINKKANLRDKFITLGIMLGILLLVLTIMLVALLASALASQDQEGQSAKSNV